MIALEFSGLLDRMAIILKEFLSNVRCLKLGFGLVQDLKAVAEALGGGNAVSVTQPYVDVGTVSRHLRLSGLSDDEVGQGGLAGLVRGHLGRYLDKQEQCSAWGQRPLSESQINYAAMDAQVLLDLFDVYTKSVTDKTSNLLASTMFKNRNEDSADDGPQWWKPLLDAPSDGQDDEDRFRMASLGWGIRLELINGRRVFIPPGDVKGISKDRKGGKEGDLKKGRSSEGRAQAEMLMAQLPSVIPWCDPRDAAFLVDSMCEGLAKHLRMYGVNCATNRRSISSSNASRSSSNQKIKLEMRLQVGSMMVTMLHHRHGPVSIS